MGWGSGECVVYEAFYGMRRRPFSPIPQPECFVPLPQMAEAVRELRNCVERDQGIAVLTAPAGAGKTLLCKRLCFDLAGQFLCVFLGTSRFPSRRALLQGILYELGQPYIGLSEQEARLGIFDALRLEETTDGSGLRGPAGQHPMLLVMDEAHLLPARFLEELRTLADYHVDGRPLIHVVLSGQLALEETLSEGPLGALNQRVGCHVCLEALGADESAEYIRHRLSWAECDVESIFSPEALSLIVHAAEGNPRRINQLADHALLIAFAEEERLVSKETVQDALVDLRELPLQWNEPLALSWEETEVDPLSSLDASLDAARLPPGNTSPVAIEWGPDPEPTSGGFAESDAIEGWSSGEADSPRFSFEPQPAASREMMEAATTGSERPEPAVFETGLPDQAQEGSTELMSSFMTSPGYEEFVVEDRYARLDRRSESGSASDIEVPAIQPALALDAAIDSALEVSREMGGTDRSIEEELRDLLMAMQSEVAAAISPATLAGAHPQAGPSLYDVVEPEDESMIDAVWPGRSSPETVPFTPSIAAFAEEEVIPASVPESLTEPAEAAESSTEPPTRRYAQLFSRLQRQRSHIDVLLKRDRQ